MATSAVQICNLALSEIGTRSSIASFDDGSEEGYQCGLWYDQLRQTLLRTAPWGFARGQLALTQLGDLSPDNTSPYPNLFKYAYPADCIKMRYILCPPPTFTGVISPPVTGVPVSGPTWMTPSRANRYMAAADVDANGNQIKVLLCNVYQALGIYTRNITNVALFDPLFVDALVAALALKMVIPLSGNVGQKQAFMQSAEMAITAARVADGNEAIPRADHSVDWITTRGVGSVFGYGPGLIDNYSTWGNWYAGNDDMNWGM